MLFNQAIVSFWRLRKRSRRSWMPYLALGIGLFTYLFLFLFARSAVGMQALNTNQGPVFRWNERVPVEDVCRENEDKTGVEKDIHISAWEAVYTTEPCCSG